MAFVTNNSTPPRFCAAAIVGALKERQGNDFWELRQSDPETIVPGSRLGLPIDLLASR